jgi:hypothetical protein
MIDSISSAVSTALNAGMVPRPLVVIEACWEKLSELVTRAPPIPPSALVP